MDEVRSRLTMERSMQRLPEGRIREAILSEDNDVRKFAIRYFSGSFSTDPGIVSTLIQGAGKFGVEKIGGDFGAAQELPLTKASIDWILENLRATENFPSAWKEFDGSMMACPLAYGDLDLLVPYRERIESDESICLSGVREVLGERFALRDWDEAACWDELEKYCETQAAREAGQDVPERSLPPPRVIEALVRWGPDDRDRVREWLQGSCDEEPSGADGWKQIVAAEIAGAMRDAAFVPDLVRLVRKFPEADFLVANCTDALVKIGGSAVVDAIRANAGNANEYYWTSAAEILSRNRSQEAIDYLAERLEGETDLETRNYLASALIQQCVPDALEIARGVVLENRKRNDWLIDSIGLKDDVIIFADFLGERFPEYDEWKREIEEIRSAFSQFRLRRPEVETKPAETAFINPPSLPESKPLARAGRNDPCPCGSGKKYKKCCLNKPESVVVEELGKDGK